MKDTGKTSAAPKKAPVPAPAPAKPAPAAKPAVPAKPAASGAHLHRGRPRKAGCTEPASARE